MNHACVTLDEVLTAARVRAASIVSETSGYLALALGDATSRAPCAIDERAVTLSTEGTVAVTRRGPARSPEQAAEALRSVLARLLAVGTGTTMPSLAAAARPRVESDGGPDGVIQEIEAALIPVNRAAAKRALARLARETLRAREAGKLNRATLPPPVPSSVPPPIRPSAPPVVAAFVKPPPAPQNPVAPMDAVFVEPAAPDPTPLSARESLARSLTPLSTGYLAAAPVVTPLPAPAAAPCVEEASDGASSAVTAVPRDVLDSTWVGGFEMPLLRTVTPFPPDALPREEFVIAPRDYTPTLLGVAPASFVPSPAFEDDAPTETNTVVDARAEIEVPPSATPTGVSHVAARPTEDSAFSLEAEAARAPRVTAEIETAIPVAAPPPAIPTCSNALADAKPTRADDLIARFGASCVDDANLAATRASLRHMAGLDLTPSPSRPGSPPAAAVERPVDGGVFTVRGGAPPTDRTPRPPPQRHATARRRAGAVMAWGIVLGLGLLAIYRFVPEASGLVMLARDMLRPAPGATPPRAPASVEMPGANAPPATPPAPPPPVDRGATRAERGTAQRQR